MVLDASIALSWLYERAVSHERALAQRLLLQLPTEPAVVPALWSWEIGNALLVAERRHLTSAAQVSDYLQRMRMLPIEIDSAGPGERLEVTLALARQHALSVYDAAYLELAVRLNAPLATFDDALGRAAAACGLRYGD